MAQTPGCISVVPQPVYMNMSDLAALSSSARAHGHPDAPYGRQDAPYGYHQDEPYGRQDAPYGHQDATYGHRDAPYGHQDAPYGQQDAPYGHAASHGRQEAAEALMMTEECPDLKTPTAEDLGGLGSDGSGSSSGYGSQIIAETPEGERNAERKDDIFHPFFACFPLLLARSLGYLKQYLQVFFL